MTCCKPDAGRPYNILDIDICQDETFEFPHQLMLMNPDGSESALDLTSGGVITSINLDFYVRPRFDHTTLIKRLSTDPGIGGVILDDAATGKIGLYLEQSLVATQLPVGVWQHFLVRTVAPRKFELYRGTFRVHPARLV
jgi:hypothetical protein